MIGVLVGGLLWEIGGITAVSWVAASATLLALLFTSLGSPALETGVRLRKNRIRGVTTSGHTEVLAPVLRRSQRFPK